MARLRGISANGVGILWGTDMHEIQEYRPGDEKIAIALLVIVVLLVASGSIGYMLGLRSGRTDVHDNGNGTAAVGSQLTETETAVNNAKNGIEAAAGTADHIGTGIADAKESAGYIQHTADTSAEIIADCQSIIDAVRSRGQAGKVAH